MQLVDATLDCANFFPKLSKTVCNVLPKLQCIIEFLKSFEKVIYGEKISRKSGNLWYLLHVLNLIHIELMTVYHLIYMFRFMYCNIALIDITDVHRETRIQCHQKQDVNFQISHLINTS